MDQYIHPDALAGLRYDTLEHLKESKLLLKIKVLVFIAGGWGGVLLLKAALFKQLDSNYELALDFKNTITTSSSKLVWLCSSSSL